VSGADEKGDASAAHALLTAKGREIPPAPEIAKGPIAKAATPAQIPHRRTAPRRERIKGLRPMIDLRVAADSSQSRLTSQTLAFFPRAAKPLAGEDVR